MKKGYFQQNPGRVAQKAYEESLQLKMLCRCLKSAYVHILNNKKNICQDTAPFSGYNTLNWSRGH